MHAPHRSLWLQQALDGDARAPPLAGRGSAPTSRSSAAASSGCGRRSGSSSATPAATSPCSSATSAAAGRPGRNGGLRAVLVAEAGQPRSSSAATEEALRLGHASAAAIDEIAAFCDEHGIDAQFRRGGFLWTATTPSARRAPGTASSRAVRAHWASTPSSASRPTEVARRAGSDRAPRRRVRGAARRPSSPRCSRAACGASRSSLGVRIYERRRRCASPRERPLVIETAGGTFAADKLVVATNAWAAGAARAARARSSSSPATSSPPRRSPTGWREIGWTGGEGITDSQMMVAYYRTTARRTDRVRQGHRGRRPTAAASATPSTATPRRAGDDRVRLPPLLPRAGRRADRRTTGAARSTARRTSLPDPRPPRRPRAHALRRRLERQRRRPERPRRTDPRQPRARHATTSGARRRSSTARRTPFPPEPVALHRRAGWCARP